MKTVIDVRVVEFAAGLQLLPGWPARRAAIVARASEQLRALHALGVGNVVDTTPIGSAARELIPELACPAGITITACVGVDDHPTEALAELTPTQLADVLLEGGDATSPLLVGGGSGGEGDWSEVATRAISFAFAEAPRPVIVRCATAGAIGAATRLIGWGVEPGLIVIAGLDAGVIRLDVVDAAAALGVMVGFTREGADHLARAAAVAYSVYCYGEARVRVGSLPGALVGLSDALDRFGIGTDVVGGLLGGLTTTRTVPCPR